MGHKDDKNWHFELTLLGVGGAFDADQGVANTGALLKVVEAGTVVERVLIDCGHTCGRQLGQLGLTYQDIDTVLVTHAHGDHIDGLEVLGYKSRFLYSQRIPVIAPRAVLEDAWSSLKPKMGWLQMAKGQSVATDMDGYFEAREVREDDPVTLGGGRIKVDFHRVEHVAEMAAYCIVLSVGESGPVVRWSGDTIFNVNSPLFAGFDMQRGDRVFHDCLFYPYYDVTVHTHYEQLAALAKEVRAGLVMIHHGRLEDEPPLMEGMLLGQPLQTFRFDPK
jgi:ribonuclease BN (tRNA processing enzyme)